MEKTIGRFLINVTIPVVALAAIACGSGSDLQHTIRGRLLVDGAVYWTTGGPCTGKDGYDDLREGAQVVVRDADGDALATGTLDKGLAVGGSRGRTGRCEFGIEVSVPRSDFYSIEVAHRGEITYSYEELESSRWQVDLSVG